MKPNYLECIKHSVAEMQLIYSNPISKNRRIAITCSHKAYEVFRFLWNDSTIELKEDFKVLYLNRANEVLGSYDHASGGTSGVVVDVKHILGIALKANAESIILCHNHPSGNLKPSRKDIEFTKKIGSACTFLDIKLLDHIILTKESYYSFLDEGEL